MSDAVIIAIAILIFVLALAWLYRVPITHRFFGAGSISANLEMPGIKLGGSFGEVPPQIEASQKKELEKSKSAHEWDRDRIADLYWLGSDLSFGMIISTQSDANTVKHYIRQCFWHASQLALGDPVEKRFKWLCEKAGAYTVDDWNNVNKRVEIYNELNALLHAIAFIVEDEKFRGSPPSDWSEC